MSRSLHGRCGGWWRSGWRPRDQRGGRAAWRGGSLGLALGFVLGWGVALVVACWPDPAIALLPPRVQGVAGEFRPPAQRLSERLPLNSAEALNRQGRDYLNQGQADRALVSWQAAAAAYRQAGDHLGMVKVQLNQVQALRDLGFYRRGLGVVEEAIATLEHHPDDRLRAIALHRQGDLLRLTGNLDAAQSRLEDSIALAEPRASQAAAWSEILAAARFSQGEIARTNGNQAEALAHYQHALALPLATPLRVNVQLARLQALMALEQWSEANLLWPQIQTQLDALPPTHLSLSAQIQLTEALIRLPHSPRHTPSDGVHPALTNRWSQAAQRLTQTAQQSATLGDRQVQSYALGTLGSVYEQTQDWSAAHQVTQVALALAQTLQAQDLSYRWLWQLGRIERQQGHSSAATAHYREAVRTLQTLRRDLVGIEAEVQFSFREDVEPVYRELVGLILQPNPETGQPIQDPARLEEARSLIESLQIAELEDFLHKPCADAHHPVDQIDERAAVVYPIMLRDRLDILLSLPHQPLRHYTTPVSQDDLEQVVQRYRQGLVLRSQRNFFPPAQQLYQWLIQPMLADLQQYPIQTLVFVLDGQLKNVPMAALHNGRQFLVETYTIALTPSLRLLGPHPLGNSNMATLALGISQARSGFAPLNYVADELESIQTLVPQHKILLNHEFTLASFTASLSQAQFPIVHLATHGQFSSDARQTFVLSWDTLISLKHFDRILRTAASRIELLILSACQTAIGDSRAALGLTGMAVDTGARSTLGTLWSVDDAASAALMQQFYQRLGQGGLSRAEALRQAQVALLRDPQYQHPLYWASYVMVGNWL